MPITDQSKSENGSIDAFMQSHFPINLAKEFKEYTYLHKECELPWMKRIQLLLQPNQGMIFDGNLIHNIHGNKSNIDRLTAFWVIELQDDRKEPNYNLSDLPPMDWTKYALRDFKGEWITKVSTYLEWSALNKEALYINLNQEFQFRNTDDVFELKQEEESDNQNDED